MIQKHTVCLTQKKFSLIIIEVGIFWLYILKHLSAGARVKENKKD